MRHSFIRWPFVDSEAKTVNECGTTKRMTRSEKETFPGIGDHASVTIY
jgi:hypothetical protein